MLQRLSEIFRPTKKTEIKKTKLTAAASGGAVEPTLMGIVQVHGIGAEIQKYLTAKEVAQLMPVSETWNEHWGKIESKSAPVPPPVPVSAAPAPEAPTPAPEPAEPAPRERKKRVVRLEEVKEIQLLSAAERIRLVKLHRLPRQELLERMVNSVKDAEFVLQYAKYFNFKKDEIITELLAYGAKDRRAAAFLLEHAEVFGLQKACSIKAKYKDVTTNRILFGDDKNYGYKRVITDDCVVMEIYRCMRRTSPLPQSLFVDGQEAGILAIACAEEPGILLEMGDHRNRTEVVDIIKQNMRQSATFAIICLETLEHPFSKAGDPSFVVELALLHKPVADNLLHAERDNHSDVLAEVGRKQAQSWSWPWSEKGLLTQLAWKYPGLTSYIMTRGDLRDKIPPKEWLEIFKKDTACAREYLRLEQEEAWLDQVFTRSSISEIAHAPGPRQNAHAPYGGGFWPEAKDAKEAKRTLAAARSDQVEQEPKPKPKSEPVSQQSAAASAAMIEMQEPSGSSSSMSPSGQS